jgi:hypothetical protein
MMPLKVAASQFRIGVQLTACIIKHNVCDWDRGPIRSTMTVIDFENLSRTEQIDCLQQDGVHIGKRTQEGKVVVLLQLNTFYVEVYYKKYRKKIERLKVTSSTSILKDYLDQVKLDNFTPLEGDLS